MTSVKPVIFYSTIKPGDYDDLVAFWKSLDDAYMDLENDDSPEILGRFLAIHQPLCVKATMNNRIVGTALGSHDYRYGYISHVAVAPEYRRQGIGRRAVEICKENIAKKGIAHVIIFAFTDHPERLDFWRALNWVERGDSVNVFVTNLRKE